MAGAVEGAAGAGPDPGGLGAGGDVERPRLSRVEPHAAARERARPHRVAAAVHHGDGRRVGAGDDGDGEEEKDDDASIGHG